MKYLWKVNDKCWFKIAFKIHDKSSKIWPIGQTSVQNLQKSDPKSMKMRPWNVFGAKSRPCWLQDPPTRWVYSTLWRLFGRKWCPRAALREPMGSQNLSKITFLWTWCHSYLPKVASGICSQKKGVNLNEKQSENDAKIGEFRSRIL